MEVLRGKYRIVREIARSNDIVYEAVDITLGRKVALKELNLPSSVTGQARRERILRFEREAKAAGRLTHPNIVSIFESGEENGRYFIAMEFLEGQNLRDRMQTLASPFPVKEALDIIAQVLDALHYAHAHNVIHRDIKPDNIQILPGGQVKLTDFGIARLTEEDPLTSHGQIFGTPSYMSPEQIEGKHIDHRSDLFSVGVVLYEMLAGRKPFTGDSVVAITYAIMQAPPPPLYGVAAPIEQALQRALEKNPLHRPRTAEELKFALREAERQPATFAPPMQRTGMGAGTNYGYGGSGAFAVVPPTPAPAPPVPAGGYAPPPHTGQTNTPWNWNNGTPSVIGGPANPPPALLNPQAPGALPPNALSNPPFPARRSEPLVQLSPAARSFLGYLTLAALLGGVIAFGYVGFLKSYENYKSAAGRDQTLKLMREGNAAFEAKNYRLAATRFEAALKVGNAAEGAKVRYNLAISYTELGNQFKKSDPSGANRYYALARDLFAEALRTSDSDLAEKAQRGLDSLPAGFETSVDAARPTRGSSGRETTKAPPFTPSASSSSRSQTTADAKNAAAPALNDFRARAAALLREGMIAEQNGDKKVAIEKYTEAYSAAIGTPESREAKSRLDQLIAQQRSSGGEGWQ